MVVQFGAIRAEHERRVKDLRIWIVSSPCGALEGRFFVVSRRVLNVQKRANLVDLEEVLQKMNVWLQEAAPIHPRTIRPNFEKIVSK